jgi:hypothetical protein
VAPKFARSQSFLPRKFLELRYSTLTSANLAQKRFAVIRYDPP